MRDVCREHYSAYHVPQEITVSPLYECQYVLQGGIATGKKIKLYLEDLILKLSLI